MDHSENQGEHGTAWPQSSWPHETGHTTSGSRPHTHPPLPGPQEDPPLQQLEDRVEEGDSELVTLHSLASQLCCLMDCNPQMPLTASSIESGLKGGPRGRLRGRRRGKQSNFSLIPPCQVCGSGSPSGPLPSPGSVTISPPRPKGKGNCLPWLVPGVSTSLVISLCSAYSSENKLFMRPPCEPPELDPLPSGLWKSELAEMHSLTNVAFLTRWGNGGSVRDHGETPRHTELPWCTPEYAVWGHICSSSQGLLCTQSYPPPRSGFRAAWICKLRIPRDTLWLTDTHNENLQSSCKAESMWRIFRNRAVLARAVCPAWTFPRVGGCEHH